MSSTDPDKVTLALRFYEDRLVPVAEQRPGPRFPMAPESEGVTSYWEDRSDPVAPIVSIEDNQIEELLKALWAQEPQLAELVPELLELARQLVPDEEAEEDLDPYIYRMF